MILKKFRASEARQAVGETAVGNVLAAVGMCATHPDTRAPQTARVVHISTAASTLSIASVTGGLVLDVFGLFGAAKRSK